MGNNNYFRTVMKSQSHRGPPNHIGSRNSMGSGFKPAKGKYYMPSKLYSSSTRLARQGKKTLSMYRNTKFQSSFTMQQPNSKSVIFPKQRRFRNKNIVFDTPMPGVNQLPPSIT